MVDFNTYYPVISAVVILLLFLWWYIRYDILLLGKTKNKLKEITLKISSLSSEEDNMDNIDRIFSDIAYEPLNRIWDSYCSRKERGDLSDAFNTYDCVVIPSSRKKSEAIPAVLVTLGILAVFGGLVLGMGNIQPDAAPADLVAHLAKTAGGALLAGMTGIVLSVIYQLIDRSSYQAALTQLSNFCYVANTKLLYSDIEAVQKRDIIEELLVKIEQEFKTGNSRTIDAIQSFTDKIQNFVSEFGEKLTSVQSEGLQSMINAFLDKLSSSTGDYLRELEISYGKLSEAQKQSSEFITALMKSAADSSEQQRAMNSVSERVVENVLACTEKITDNTRLAAEAAEKTKEFAAILSDLMQNAEQSEQDTASRFSEIINNMLQKLDSGLNGNIDRLGEAASKLLEELDNRVFSINVYTDVISKEISGLSSNLNTSVGSFGNQMNECIQNSFKSFDSSVADICDRLGTTAAAIRDAVDELPKVLSGYKADIKEAQVVSNEK